jgi:hypothetical protein
LIGYVLACDGGAYFDDGSPDYGMFKCAVSFPPTASEAYQQRDDLLAAARRKGWRIGPKGDAMCPDCGKPDPRTLRLIESFRATQRVIA